MKVLNTVQLRLNRNESNEQDMKDETAQQWK